MTQIEIPYPVLAKLPEVLTKQEAKILCASRDAIKSIMTKLEELQNQNAKSLARVLAGDLQAPAPIDASAACIPLLQQLKPAITHDVEIRLKVAERLEEASKAMKPKLDARELAVKVELQEVNPDPRKIRRDSEYAKLYTEAKALRVAGDTVRAGNLMRPGLTHHTAAEYAAKVDDLLTSIYEVA